MSIKGIPVGTTTPRPDWNQKDPRKADFIKNKPDIEGKFSEIDDELTEMSDIVAGNTASIGALQEIVDNLDNPGGGGGITDEELAKKVADAIQAEWDDGSGYLLDTLDMVAWSAGYSATEGYLQEYGFADVDEEGNPVRNVPTYEELDEQIGDIETALDSILAIQNQLIGGDGV